MKFNKIMLSAFLVFGASTMVQADEPGKDPVLGATGKVTFTGKIVDAPCSIAPESVDQTVKMGSIANGALKAGGKSTPQPFMLKLTGCDVVTKKSVETTFTGGASETQDGLLGVIGSAKGVSVGIGDTAGNLIPLGKPVPSKLIVGSNELNFTTFVQGDQTAEVIPGDFQAVAGFTLAYQ
ncbi:fimbrial protein [Yersinia enterocolitica]|uniref:fimbrial protein n=1 Tax=Yersinia enterocolitica TaxID=630 RepID=UPI00227B3BD0|nr:fimbrial protein [Yersinia enterocolitica]MCY1688747.1 fimbrial protein [Yersinia enterocolitica]